MAEPTKVVLERRDESASVSDADFIIESHSDKNAFTQPPADTTEGRALAAPVDEAVVEEEPEQPEQAEVEEPPDASHTSASRATVEAKAQTPQQQPKSKNKTPLKERTAQLKHEVDTLTHAKHRTKSELDAAERRLADLNRQIAEHDAKLKGVPPAKDAKTQPTEDAEPEMPAHPNYRDFQTDEEYEKAVGTWRADMATWQRGQTERLEKRIASGIESRFKDAGQEAQFTAAVGRLEATRDKVAASKPDWTEKAATLADVTSSWHDPERHGPHNRTPFLTDLARTLLMQGNEEGGELLYWLGEDADRAQAVADLLPTRPLRDALVAASSVIPLLNHFATDEGAKEFEALKQMHPVRVHQAIGALSVRLAGASSGSPAKPQPITKAHPSARPPAGTPGARGQTEQAGQKRDFADDLLEENARDLMKAARSGGVTLTIDDAREHAKRRLYG